MIKKHRTLITLLNLLALLILLPVMLTILYSLFAPTEIKAFMHTRNIYGNTFMEIKLSPKPISLGQYYNILIEDMGILHYFSNSLLYAFAILLGQALFIPSLAYALSRFEFAGREVLSFIVIILLLLPFQVTMVPNVLTLRSIGLLNTVWAVVLPSVVSPFYVFLLRQYMISMPNDMFEAAQIDGAGPIHCFFSITLPVSRPMLGAAAALSFADCWNMVEQPLAYLTEKQDLYPLSIIFNQLTQESTGIEFAGATLYLLPALFIYLFFQNDILTGIQLSELK